MLIFAWVVLIAVFLITLVLGNRFMDLAEKSIREIDEQRRNSEER